MGADHEFHAASGFAGSSAFIDRIAAAVTGSGDDHDDSRSVHLQAADMLVRAIGDLAESGEGIPNVERLSKQAHRLVRVALERHDGPGDRALQDVLWAYISAPPRGRDAMFLAVASRAVGASVEATSSRYPSEHPDPQPSPKTSAPDLDEAELLAWARSTLELLSRLTQQSGS